MKVVLERLWMAQDENTNFCAEKQTKLTLGPNLATDRTDIPAEISHLNQSNHVNIPKYINSFRMDYGKVLKRNLACD